MEGSKRMEADKEFHTVGGKEKERRDLRYTLTDAFFRRYDARQKDARLKKKTRWIAVYAAERTRPHQERFRRASFRRDALDRNESDFFYFRRSTPATSLC